MPNLTSQMEAVCRRFEELSIRLNQPETAADPAQFRRLMQEYHEAQPVVDAYHALTTAQDHLAQAKPIRRLKWRSKLPIMPGTNKLRENIMAMTFGSW